MAGAGVGRGSRLSQKVKKSLGSKQAKREGGGGRALRPGLCPPHSRTTPAAPPGGKTHPGKALAHSQRYPERSGARGGDDEKEEDEQDLQWEIKERRIH